MKDQRTLPRTTPEHDAYGMAVEPAVEREMAKGDAAALTEVLRPGG
ncbi:hypothetical protein [Streptomyces sp. NK08204]|nr:hypothetical protein [Streptomyces sp. NK08204]